MSDLNVGDYFIGTIPRGRNVVGDITSIFVCAYSTGGKYQVIDLQDPMQTWTSSDWSTADWIIIKHIGNPFDTARVKQLIEEYSNENK